MTVLHISDGWEETNGIAVAARLLDHMFHIVAHAVVFLHIRFHIRLGLVGEDADILRKGKRGDAVDDPEVHRLGSAAQKRRDLLQRDVEHA